MVDRGATDGAEVIEGKGRGLVDLAGGPRQAVKTALHGFSSLEEGIAFEMNGEGHKIVTMRASSHMPSMHAPMTAKLVRTWKPIWKLRREP